MLQRRMTILYLGLSPLKHQHSDGKAYQVCIYNCSCWSCCYRSHHSDRASCHIHLYQSHSFDLRNLLSGKERIMYLWRDIASLDKIFPSTLWNWSVNPLIRLFFVGKLNRGFSKEQEGVEGGESKNKGERERERERERGGGGGEREREVTLRKTKWLVFRNANSIIRKKNENCVETVPIKINL